MGAPLFPDQRSTEEQLDDLERLAVQNGLYDAQDWLRAQREASRERRLRYHQALQSASTVTGS